MASSCHCTTDSASCRPETHEYGFRSQDEHQRNSEAIWREYVWGRKAQHSDSLLLSKDCSVKNGVLVAVQPPSLLTSSILFDFVSTHSVSVTFVTSLTVDLTPWSGAYFAYHKTNWIYPSSAAVGQGTVPNLMTEDKVCLPNCQSCQDL